MKKPLILLALSFLSALSGFAQEPAGGCSGSAKGIYLHGNKVRAYINNSGSLFFNGNNAAFEVPFSNISERNTIYTQGLWLGAWGPEGGLRIAAQTYGLSNNKYDFYPGPVGQDNLADCRQWDRVWTVYRHQIEAHIEDWADNGAIDNPISAVLAWPAAGNPYFEAIHGFPLPFSSDGWAPFADLNNDGIYDPTAGDYPMISQSALVPEQICWTLFNDLAGPHEESGGTALGVEVQLTAWAFNCEDNRQLDNTVFLSYRIINRGEAPLDSMYVAPWLDFMLGCFNDDYIGSAPALNTVFSYNQDNVDGTYIYASCAPKFSFGKNPPVQAATILNHPLSSVMYYDQFTSVYDPPIELFPPQSPIEYYYYLTAHWRTGVPLTYGAEGYDASLTNPQTNFVYPGDPNDPDSWALANTHRLGFSNMLIPAVYVGQLSVGEEFTLDMAQSYFRERGHNHLQNVTAMYAGIERLQEWYDGGFASVCTPPAICREGCIWPGDANNDGISNHYDLLSIGLAKGSQGPGRIYPPNWFPQYGEDWGFRLPGGTDYKHADADGSGDINIGDFSISAANYQLTRPGYHPQRDVYREGPEIYFRNSPGWADTLSPGQSRFKVIDIKNIPELYGLAFSVDYDTNYFEVFRPYLGTGFDQNIPEYRGQDRAQIDYARLAASPESAIPSGNLLILWLKARSSFTDTLPSNATPVRIKNIKAIRRDGTEIPVGAAAAYFTILGIPVQAEAREAAADGIHLFPNPTDGRLELRFPGRQLEGIEVFDATGRRVWQQEERFADAASLELKGLPGGVYFVKMLLEGRIVVRRVFLVPRSS